MESAYGMPKDMDEVRGGGLVQTFQSRVGWIHCFEPEVMQSIMGGTWDRVLIPWLLENREQQTGRGPDKTGPSETGSW